MNSNVINTTTTRLAPNPFTSLLDENIVTLTALTNHPLQTAYLPFDFRQAVLDVSKRNLLEGISPRGPLIYRWLPPRAAINPNTAPRMVAM